MDPTMGWNSQNENALAWVVLFDIDGTLITGPSYGPSPGVRAMAESSRLATGLPELHANVEFAGRTDCQIVRDMLVAGGAVDPDLATIQSVIDRYVELLERGVQSRPYRSIGSVRQGVIALREAGATVGLGTGNVRRGAEAKMRSANLADLFDFDLGGYGDDGDTRAEVLAAGVCRCDPTGLLRVIVVGDTPHDVRAAHAINAPCIAVHTGEYDARSLADSGADVVLANIDLNILSVVRAIVSVT